MVAEMLMSRLEWVSCECITANAAPSNEYHGYVPEKLNTKEANVVREKFDGIVDVSNNGTCKVKC